MSEPIQKPKRTPESYNPKKPEIANLMKEATDTAGKQLSDKGADAMAEPRIIKKAFNLVGVKGNIAKVWPNFGPLLNELYKTVNDKLSLMNELAKPVRMVGFWHMDTLPSGQQEYSYFAGVEADCVNPPEGLVIKTLPESSYAVFTEQRRGTIGSPEGYAYKQWLPFSGYDGNEEIPGDFEIYNNMTDTGPECEAEILIPVKQREICKKNIEPLIIRRTFSLVGVEKVIKRGQDFEPVLTEMRNNVFNHLNNITGLAEPARMIGFTHVCKLPSGKNEYRHFAGVEANCENPPDELITKNLPESLYAVFKQQKDGQKMGGPGGYGYKWLRASDYKASDIIKGDFTIYNNMTDTNPDCEYELFIPLEENYT